MSMTAPQERQAAHRRHPEGEAAPSPHELKYRHDVAHYVADMLTELRQIAGKAGFDKLVGSLDAAYYDAYAALDANAIRTAAAPREKISSGVEPTAG
jgi:hypothetical protein